MEGMTMKLGINKSFDLIKRLSLYVFFKNNVEIVLCPSDLGLKIITMSNTSLGGICLPEACLRGTVETVLYHSAFWEQSI